MKCPCWCAIDTTQAQGAIEALVQLGLQHHSKQQGVGAAPATWDVDTRCEWCGVAVVGVGLAWRRPVTLPDIVASTNMVLQLLQAVDALPPAEGLLLCPRCAPVLRGAVRMAQMSADK